MNAFFLGWEDALSSCGFATAGVFLIILLSRPPTTGSIIVTGMGFIGSCLFFFDMMIQGGFDPILRVPGVTESIRITYLAMGIIFFVCGFWLALQWWKQRIRNKGFTVNLILLGPTAEISQISLGKRIGNWFWLFVFAGLAGVGLSFLASVDTQDYTIFILMLESSYFQQPIPPIWVRWFYLLGYHHIVLIMWVLSLCLVRYPGWREKLNVHYPLVIIALAAYFGSVGTGLIFMFR